MIREIQSRMDCFAQGFPELWHLSLEGLKSQEEEGHSKRKKSLQKAPRT